MRTVQGNREITFSVNSEVINVEFSGWHEKFTILNNTDGDLKVSGSGEFTSAYFVIPAKCAFSEYRPILRLNVGKSCSLFISAEGSGTISIISD